MTAAATGRPGGDTIPLEARIIFACDAFHAMTTDRPYREALTVEEAFRRSRRPPDAVRPEGRLDLPPRAAPAAARWTRGSADAAEDAEGACLERDGLPGAVRRPVRLDRAALRYTARAPTGARSGSGGRTNVMGSRQALKRTMKDSSATGSPSGASVGISAPFRNAPRAKESPRDQSACVIFRPSGRNHQTSGCARALPLPPVKEGRAAEHRMLGAEPEQPPREGEEHPRALVDLPVEPGDLVVLAVRVVVAALGVPELVAGEEHRHALGEEERGEDVPLLAVAQRDTSGSSVAPSTPQFHEGCRRCRRGCPRRSPRCACGRSETRSRSVNPSWAVTKLIDADGCGRRLVEVARAGEPLANSATAASPLQKSRTSRGTCRSTPTRGRGKFPTW